MIVNSIFTTNDDDVFDARIETRYVFKSVNLNQAETSIGQWIIYYRPARRARLALPPGYFAMARVEAIDPEPLRPGYLLARMADYCGFDRTVPFEEDGRYYEKALRKQGATGNPGAFSLGVRNLPKHEFERIIAAGSAPALVDSQLPRAERERAGFSIPQHLHVAEDPAAFVHEAPPTVARRIETRLVSRPSRDPAFAVIVNAVYCSRCAMIGRRVVDRHGRSETEAAHIWPVAQGGPDDVRNGIALSRSVHWMFDTGLLSIADDYMILVARRMEADIRRHLPTLRRSLIVPERRELRPHPSFLRIHRETIFEG